MNTTRRALIRSSARLLQAGILLPVLSACTAAPSAPSAPTSSAAATQAGQTQAAQPKRGGELKILYHTLATPNYDTLSTGAVTNNNFFSSMMMETLTEIDANFTPVPSLAESWSTSDDGLTYTFKLRDGVRFHNGRQMVADDVVYSFNRIQDPATNYAQASQWKVITNVTAVDPMTVAVRLARPYAPLLALLGTQPAVIVPKEEIAKGNFGEKPVGTGPFKFSDRVVDDHLTMVANKDYWRPGLPYLDKVTMLFRSDENAKVLALRAGQADWIFDAPGANYQAFVQDPNYVVSGGGSEKSQGTYAYLWFNPTKWEPARDPRVIQAIHWALDRKALADVALPGLSEPMGAGLFPAGHWAALPQPVYTPDLAKARQLLSEAGHADGLKFRMETTGLNDHSIRGAQVIKEQLKQVNVDVEIAIFPASAGSMTPLINSLNWEANYNGAAGQPDPDLAFSQYVLGQNAVKWEDQQIDDFVSKAQATAVQADRAPNYVAAQKRLLDVGLWDQLYFYNKYDVLAKYVRGFTYNANYLNGKPQMREVWLDK